MIQQFFDLPLWLSIPLALIYIMAWVGFFYTVYYFSDWRQRRHKKKNKQ